MSGGGPTAVMRHEHVEIRRAMATVADALKGGDQSAVEAALGTLSDTLAPHNMKEEQILYPMTDRALGTDGARDELVKRMQAF